MIIVMEENATEDQIVAVVDRLVQLGFDIHRSTGSRYTILGAVGSRLADLRALELLDGVNRVVRVSSPYKLAARAFRPEGTRIQLGELTIGGGQCLVMAGPGAIESRRQLDQIAAALVQRGVRIMAGNILPEYNNPYGFQGLGEEGLQIFRETAERHGLITISEVVDPAHLPLLVQYVDLIRVGPRHMKDYGFLRALARQPKPLMLTRDPATTIEEALISADYLLAEGNPQVVLCEAGIRTFETHTRLTLDLSAPAAIRRLSHLPVVVDPCRAAGRRDRVLPLSRAALASGVDGLMLDLHDDPDHALSNGAQSLTLAQFHQLMDQFDQLAPIVERWG
jgi:3-deoxy-7-phosphoheptulonate synthase